MTEVRIPLIGERFPEMGVQTTHGKMKLPEEFKGKWFVLFSHPADFTPVCTTEFVGFQVRQEKFKELDTELIGLSIDQVFSHIKWTEWIKDNIKVDGKAVEIKFPVIADDTGRIAKMLGLIHEAKGTNTVRAVFVVDPKSNIRAILYYPQELGRNVDEILRMVKGFQVSDKNGVAIPHNWPNNEIVGDHVIVPPASSENEVKKRKEAEKNGEMECFDWWLCHKKV
ncbi:MAG: peroxiredoxin [Candidatus Micrarchaeota archaeon]|nr:peroxiredoxin [Candidatus Micrarchaeota archaeon]